MLDVVDIFLCSRDSPHHSVHVFDVISNPINLLPEPINFISVVLNPTNLTLNLLKLLVEATLIPRRVPFGEPGLFNTMIPGPASAHPLGANPPFAPDHAKLLAPSLNSKRIPFRTFNLPS